MERREINDGTVELAASEGYGLRRRGTEGTPMKRVLVTAEQAADWEEVSEESARGEERDARVRVLYLAETVRRIRARYSADDEAAILRKAIAAGTSSRGLEALDPEEALSTQPVGAGPHEPEGGALEEFREYNEYAELCKREAMAWAEAQVSEQEGGGDETS